MLVASTYRQSEKDVEKGFKAQKYECDILKDFNVIFLASINLFWRPQMVLFGGSSGRYVKSGSERSQKWSHIAFLHGKSSQNSALNLGIYLSILGDIFL